MNNLKVDVCWVILLNYLRDYLHLGNNRTGPVADIRAKGFGRKFKCQFPFHVSGRVMPITINNKGMSSSKKKGFSAK